LILASATGPGWGCFRYSSFKDLAMRTSFGWVALVFMATGAAFLGGGTSAPAGDDGAETGVKLERLRWNEFQKRLANPKAKFTIVDAWSTTCGPCKENFPHLVQMHHKYGPKGLSVVSLSLDDIADKAAVAEAEKFLKQHKAVFTNVVLDEASEYGYEKLNINAIPAVFVYGPDGKEVKRFTLEDPNNQFSYEDVERWLQTVFGAPA
jgi:thiol-disulfide isomerase/thioredoxin